MNDNITMNVVIDLLCLLLEIKEKNTYIWSQQILLWCF